MYIYVFKKHHGLYVLEHKNATPTRDTTSKASKYITWCRVLSAPNATTTGLGIGHLAHQTPPHLVEGRVLSTPNAIPKSYV